MEGVHHHVEKGLPQLSLVAPDLRQLRTEVLLEADVLLPRLRRDQLEHPPDDVVQRGPLQPEPRRARKPKEIADDPIHSLDLGVGDGQAPPDRPPVRLREAGRILAEQLQLDVDRAERVAHLVGHRGRQPAQGAHLLGLKHLPFHALELRHVPRHQDRPAAGLRRHGRRADTEVAHGRLRLLGHVPVHGVSARPEGLVQNAQDFPAAVEKPGGRGPRDLLRSPPHQLRHAAVGHQRLAAPVERGDPLAQAFQDPGIPVRNRFVHRVQPAENAEEKALDASKATAPPPK